jgi:hypothetical protein
MKESESEVLCTDSRALIYTKRINVVMSCRQLGWTFRLESVSDVSARNESTKTGLT